MAKGFRRGGRLIPGLPDEVSLQCLARISHGYEGIMHCVSKGWRDAFQSKEIGRIRACEGLSGDWLFIYKRQRPAIGWQAYDPVADRWHPLPHPPGITPHARHCGFHCIILGCHLLVLGGDPGHLMDNSFSNIFTRKQASNRVFCFNPFLRKWNELPSMKTPRVDFACAVIDGRIFVAGGGSASSEIFDPEKNTWETLSEMPTPLKDCQAVSYNGHFQVLGYGTNDFKYHNFILSNDEWKVMSQAPEMSYLEFIETIEMGGQLHGIHNKVLMVCDNDTTEWKILGKLPFFEVPGHEWKRLSFHPKLVGLNGRLYLFGGREIKHDLITDEDIFVNFSIVWYCNPSVGIPLYWHVARPPIGGGGAVLACASLQQE